MPGPDFRPGDVCGPPVQVQTSQCRSFYEITLGRAVSPLEMSISAGMSGDGSFAVAALAGQVNVGSAGRLLEVLELCKTGRRDGIIVDLSRVVSMDWWAALILLWVGRVAKRRGLTFLLAGAHVSVRQVLEEAGADEVLPLRDSAAAAGHGPASSPVGAGSMPGTQLYPFF